MTVGFQMVVEVQFVVFETIHLRYLAIQVVKVVVTVSRGMHEWLLLECSFVVQFQQLQVRPCYGLESSLLSVAFRRFVSFWCDVLLVVLLILVVVDCLGFV